MGRRVRKIEFDDAMRIPAQRGSSKPMLCRECRHWKPDYCGLTCDYKRYDTPACVYGRLLITSARNNAKKKG